MNDSRVDKAGQNTSSMEGVDEAAREWFFLLSSGDATPSDHMEFDRWCASDRRHKMAFDEISKLWVDLEELRPAFDAPIAEPTAGQSGHSSAPPMPDNAVSQVAQCRRPKRTKFWFGLAAACAAAVFVAFPELNIRLSADHLTAVGEKARVELPDGSIAWLNTNTAIDVQYQPEQRQIVLLQGEARFEVARERDRPFQVLADSGQSRALGTVFSVSEVGESVVVSVIEGRVEVTSSTGSGDLWHDNTAKKAVLGLDQQVSYFPDGELSSVREFDSSKSDSWRNGYLSIRNLAFERAVEEIERYHPARILLLADKNNLGPVTARLSIKDIDSGLDAIAATQGLTVTKIGGFLIVLR